MNKKCPNCKAEINQLLVSKQIEGTISLNEPPYIEWKPLKEQLEPIVYSCPECLANITDATLNEWGLE